MFCYFLWQHGLENEEITSFLKDKEFSSLVLTSGGKLIGELEKENIEVIKLKIDKKNPYSIIKNFFLFIKIFREKKIDLVHVRSRAPAWSAIFAAKKIGIPVLTTWHGHVSNSSFIKKIYNSICLLYTSPSPRDATLSRMPSSA